MPKIISNKKVVGPYYKIIVHAPEISGSAQPGQFLQVKVNNALDPLLRRPLGIHRIEKDKVYILYEVVGRGTEILSHRKPGEYLDIIGPLGNGFNLHLTSSVQRLTILIAGGIGGAPLVFLAQKLKKYKPLVLIGANTKSKILCKEEFESLGCEVKIATDDGTAGFEGKVTELLKDSLLNNSMNSTNLINSIYACGPHLMLEDISRIIKGKNISAQASLDENMACGFGACLGCVTKTRQGYKCVCKDGPVFDIEEIVF